MSLLSLIGALLITMALLSYGLGSISVQRFKIITPGVLVFLTLGVALDLLAVSFMIFGTNGNLFSIHGILGYSATITMLINLILIWRSFYKNGLQSKIEKRVVTFSKYAYGWWVITYITGSLLILW
ncbi:MAG: hypothetical protein R2757_01335 [Draconibacterium sp.]|jgi:hypothetical protein